MPRPILSAAFVVAALCAPGVAHADCTDTTTSHTVPVGDGGVTVSAGVSQGSDGSPNANVRVGASQYVDTPFVEGDVGHGSGGYVCS